MSSPPSEVSPFVALTSKNDQSGNHRSMGHRPTAWKEPAPSLAVVYFHTMTGCLEPDQSHEKDTKRKTAALGDLQQSETRRVQTTARVHSKSRIKDNATYVRNLKQGETRRAQTHKRI